jgi:hypothetical protein
MGMTTRDSKFKVVPNNKGLVGAKIQEQSKGNVLECNPEVADCLEKQKVLIEVSKERGVYPRSVTVKKGSLVDLNIDVKTPLGGCMSVWVIPEYNVTIPMKVGINKASFIPTKEGTIAMTCSMGGKMAEIKVVN